MNDAKSPIRGGCLCGAVRYEAMSPPGMSGYCCCCDCRKASGSGFIAFMNFQASDLRITGETRRFASPALTGGEAVRNTCAACGSLVFGGILGVDDSHTIYAGSLDDASRFEPKIVIFTRDRPAWVTTPPGLKEFDTLPSRLTGAA